jgi:Pyridoxamine 5'-phosphate oxidase
MPRRFVVDGQPYVIPTAYGPAGDTIHIHGSSASRMLRALDRSVDVCVTVTLADGFVPARSAFHHTMSSPLRCRARPCAAGDGSRGETGGPPLDHESHRTRVLGGARQSTESGIEGYERLGAAAGRGFRDGLDKRGSATAAIGPADPG